MMVDLFLQFLIFLSGQLGMVVPCKLSPLHLPNHQFLFPRSHHFYYFPVLCISLCIYKQKASFIMSIFKKTFFFYTKSNIIDIF